MTDPPPPSPRQAAALRAIATLTAARGYPPTQRELGAALGLASTNAVSDLLNALRCKGWVTWQLRCPRTLRVLRPLPPSDADGTGAVAAAAATAPPPALPPPPGPPPGRHGPAELPRPSRVR